MNAGPSTNTNTAVTTLLVIEDENTLRRNVALLLEMEGYRVVAAENGLAGLEAARRERPALILCDVMMPGLDGHGVLRALREDSSFDATPFLFLTARGEPAMVRTARDLGADGYLTKPVIRGDLLAAVNERLAQGRAQAPESFAAAAETSALPGASSTPDAAPGLRDSLSVLLTGTDLLRVHGRALPETERQAQREAMKEAGAKLAAALAAGQTPAGE